MEGDAENHAAGFEEYANESEVTYDPKTETIMVVSENGYGKRSEVEDYRVTARGAKGVKTLNITEKTGRLVAIKVVTDENDLMIINKSGILIRLKLADIRVMGRATQGVRLINLTKKNDTIASVCKVMTAEEEEAEVEELQETVGGADAPVAGEANGSNPEEANPEEANPEEA